MNDKIATTILVIVMLVLLVFAFKLGAGSVDDNELELFNTQLQYERCSRDLNDTISQHKMELVYNSIDNNLDTIKDTVLCINMLVDKQQQIDNLTLQLNN